MLFLSAPAFADNCWITPLSTLRNDANAKAVQVGNFSANNTKITLIKVTTITATEQSGAMPSGTQLARVVCDIQVFYAVGFSPTATTSDNYLPADTVEYIGIAPGHRVAFCDADCT